MGHIEDNRHDISPDDTPRYPENTSNALHDSIRKLNAFGTSLGRQLTDVSDAEHELLIKGILVEPQTGNREECNKKIADYWLRKMVDAHPSM